MSISLNQPERQAVLASLVFDADGRLREACPSAKRLFELVLDEWRGAAWHRYLPEQVFPPTAQDWTVGTGRTARGQVFEHRVIWTRLDSGNWSASIEPVVPKGIVPGRVHEVAWVEALDRAPTALVVFEPFQGEYQVRARNAAAQSLWWELPSELSDGGTGWLPSAVRKSVEPVVATECGTGMAVWRDRDGNPYRLEVVRLNECSRALAHPQWLLVALPGDVGEDSALPSVAATAGVALLTVDPSGLITWANAKGSSVLGMRVEEARGRRLSQFLVEASEVESAIKGARGLVGRFCMAATGSDARWLQIQISPRGRDAALGCVVTLVDVTAEFLAMAELRRASEIARQSDIARNEFIANISHEVRTPMNGMLGLVRLLIDSDLGPTELDYAKSLERAAQNLLEVLDSVLDFSRLQSGKVEVQLEPTVIADLVDDVLSLLGPTGRAKGLEVRAEIAPNSAVQVATDAMRVRQILINLLSNAIRFTAKGEIVVRIGRNIDSRVGSCLTITIQDTGIGIPADRQEAIFESFVQASGGTTRQYGGTGLGLAISRQLAKLLGGELNLVSTEGAGSSFSLSLPHDPKAPCVVDLWPNGANRACVVASGRAGGRPDLTRLLRTLGYRVREVRSMEELEVALRERESVWVLMEPGLTGWDTTPHAAREACLARAGRVLLLGEAVSDETSGQLTGALASSLGQLRRWLALAETEGGPRRAFVFDEGPMETAGSRRTLEEAGWEVRIAATLDESALILRGEPFHLVVLRGGMDIRRRHLADRARRRAAEAGFDLTVVALANEGVPDSPWADRNLNHLTELWSTPDPTAPLSGPPGFDPDALARTTEGDRSFAATLVDSFGTRLDQLVVRWPTLLAANQHQELSHEVAELLTTSQALGATALIPVLQELQTKFSACPAAKVDLPLAVLQRFVSAAEPYRRPATHAA